MDFVRAQMTDAEREAERQYETTKRAVAEALREAQPQPREYSAAEIIAIERQRERDSADAKRRQQRRRAGLGGPMPRYNWGS